MKSEGVYFPCICVLMFVIVILSAIIGATLDKTSTFPAAEPEMELVYKCPLSECSVTECPLLSCETVACEETIQKEPAVEQEQQVRCPFPDKDRCLAGGDGVVTGFKAKCDDGIYRWTKCPEISRK